MLGVFPQTQLGVGYGSQVGTCGPHTNPLRAANWKALTNTTKLLGLGVFDGVDCATVQSN